jgi:hypothetical protein
MSVLFYQTIGMILQEWEAWGIFAYVLPFLLIFAFIYGVLSTSGILGDNKAVNAVIAAAVGLLALQFGYVSEFFRSIFPYTGIGVSVLLVALILTAIFIDKNNPKFKWIYFGLGAVIFLIVVMTALNDFTWWGGGTGWYHYDWPAILTAVIVLGVIALIVFWGGKAASSASGGTT